MFYAYNEIFRLQDILECKHQSLGFNVYPQGDPSAFLDPARCPRPSAMPEATAAAAALPLPLPLPSPHPPPSPYSLCCPGCTGDTCISWECPVRYALGRCSAGRRSALRSGEGQHGVLAARTEPAAPPCWPQAMPAPGGGRLVLN